MEQDKEKAILKEPDISYGGYTYAEYLTWNMEEMVELIKGKVFKKAAAAPKRIHQKAAASLGTKLFNFLEGHICEVYFLHLMSVFLSNPKKTIRSTPLSSRISV